MVAVSGGERNERDPNHKPFGNWSPMFVLVLFTSLSIAVYFDRGALAGCISNVEKAFHLDNTQAGIVGGAYLLFYCISSPAFAHLANQRAPLKIAGWGMLLWIVGCVATGLSFNFVTLLLARALTGVGEASFMCMASTIIDFVAPVESRSTWLSIFYVAIPAGYAMGNVVGAGVGSIGKQAWRFTFFGESAASLGLVYLLFFMAGPKNMLELDPSIQKDEDDPFAVKCKKLFRNFQFIFIALGYAAQTFVVGGLTYWTITYFTKVYDMEEATAGAAFGGITVICGILGSLTGGLLLDYIKSTSLQGETTDLNRLVVSDMLLLLPLSAIAFVGAEVAFMIHDLYTLFALLVVSELCIFATMGPINNAILWSVPLDERPFAMASTTLIIHIIGDAPAPFIIGFFADAWGWKRAMVVGALWLAPPLLCFSLALIIAKRKTSKHAGKSGDVELLEEPLINCNKGN